MKTVFTNLTEKIDQLKEDSKYDRGYIFMRARYIYKNSICTWSEALKQSWDEVKKVVYKKRNELKLAINKLAQQFEVKFSPNHNQQELDNRMLAAGLSGAKMN